MKMLKYIVLAAFLPLAVSVQQATAQTTYSGVELWAQNCGNCHTAQPGNRYSADWWDSIIDHMALQARLTDAEAEAIVGFLKSGAHKVAEAETVQPPLAVHEAGAILSTGPSPEEWMSTFDAKKEFETLCVACHGKKGKGNGPAAVAFNPRPADFTDAKFQESKTDAELTESLAKGKAAMPPFGEQLSAEDIKAMIVYIRSFKK